MNRKILTILTLSGIILFAISCKKDKVLPPVDIGYDYYPAEVGQWIEYEVDSVVYDDFTGTVDTFHYYIKEVFESEFYDNQGRPSIRIERFLRPDDTSSYVLKDIWYLTKTTSMVEKVEENKRYVKLAFPIGSNQEWDGNAFNTEDPLYYEYEDIDEAYTLNSFSFDSTVTVMQFKETTAINEDLQYEIFAKDVGMIKKKFLHLEKIYVSGNWEIESGVILDYNMINYGKN